MGNSYNLCYHLPSGTDDSCSKWSHFGSNLEEPVSQDSILCSSCWFGLHWLLHWVTNSTILCFEQTWGNDRKGRPVLYWTALHCTGLLSQPFYVLNKLGELTGRVNLSCFATIVVTNASGHFVSLTDIVMTIIAVEIWLHMSRRSLLTVRRVVIVYTTSAVLLIAFVSYHMCNWYYRKRFFSTYAVFFVFGASLCFLSLASLISKFFELYANSKVKYKQIKMPLTSKNTKSLFSQFILALFLLSYVPFVSCFLVVYLMDIFGTKPSIGAFNVCSAISYFSSFANPLLCYWRVKKVRDSVRRILRKYCCKETG